MSPPHVTKEDVGTLWTRDDGSVWRLITYADAPTVSWERIDIPPQPKPAGFNPTRVGGVVGSPITDGFVRLIREEQP